MDPALHKEDEYYVMPYNDPCSCPEILNVPSTATRSLRGVHASNLQTPFLGSSASVSLHREITLHNQAWPNMSVSSSLRSEISLFADAISSTFPETCLVNEPFDQTWAPTDDMSTYGFSRFGKSMDELSTFSQPTTSGLAPSFLPCNISALDCCSDLDNNINAIIDEQRLQCPGGSSLSSITTEGTDSICSTCPSPSFSALFSTGSTSATNSPRPEFAYLASSSPNSQPSSISHCQSRRTNLSRWGIQTSDGSWRCAFPDCTSKTRFRRGCDLRKHYSRHSKHLHCRFDRCPKSLDDGFSNSKDRKRHEARHNPHITCESKGCPRVFSRMDNMKDHFRRIHQKGKIS